MKTGIYQIRHIVKHQRYVGGTADKFNTRWNNHKSKLNNGKHANPKLQNAWNKYGAKLFVFEVIEYVTRLDGMTDEQWGDFILEREQYYLDTLLFASCNDSRFHQLGYNIRRVAQSNLGVRPSEETKKKISQAHKGKIHSSEHRKNVSIAKTGVKLSLSHRLALSKSHMGQKSNTLGKRRSDETKAKISASLKGRCAGEKHPMAKLTKEDVLKIRQLFNEGMSGKNIAIQFNVNPTTISCIKLGKTWGCV